MLQLMWPRMPHKDRLVLNRNQERIKVENPYGSTISDLLSCSVQYFRNLRKLAFTADGWLDHKYFFCFITDLLLFKQYIFWHEATKHVLSTPKRTPTNGFNRNWRMLREALTLMHVRMKAFKHSCLIADRLLNHLKQQYTSIGASAHWQLRIPASEKSRVKESISQSLSYFNPKKYAVLFCL